MAWAPPSIASSESAVLVFVVVSVFAADDAVLFAPVFAHWLFAAASSGVPDLASAPAFAVAVLVGRTSFLAVAGISDRAWRPRYSEAKGAQAEEYL